MLDASPSRRRHLATVTGSLVTALVLAAGGGARGTDAASDTLIHADSAHAAGFTGAGITVAVLDTGVDHGDAALASRVVAEHCFVPPAGCPGDQAEADGPRSAQDDEGHGTAVAEIVAETAPGVSLVVVKVADANGRTTSNQVMAGLDWVRTHHPEVSIVNVSLAGDIRSRSTRHVRARTQGRCVSRPMTRRMRLWSSA